MTDISVDCVFSMPYRSVRKKKERNRKYYACNSEQLKARGISLYEEDPSKKKAAAQTYYDAHREERKASFSSYYEAHREERKASFSSHYDTHREERKASFSSHYNAHREERKACFSSYYDAHREERKASARAFYNAHKEGRQASLRIYYDAHRSTRLKYFRKYHCCTQRVNVSKARYDLAQPSQLVMEKYRRSVLASIQGDSEMKSKLMEQQHFVVPTKLTRKDLSSAVVRLAAKRLVGKSLQLRKKYAGLLLNSIKYAKSIPLEAKSDFGKGCHTRSTEPYFYEAAYLYVRDSPIPVNEEGECVVARAHPESDSASHPESDSATGAGCKQVPTGCAQDESDKKCRKWECSTQCKPLTLYEVDAIVSFKASFGLPVEKVRQALAECDMGCPFGHYSKLVGSSPVGLRGHPIVCYNGELCTSVLRILRAASTHFPVLRKFLAHVTTALSAHRSVCDIDNALKNGNHRSLIKITGVKSLLSCDVEEKYQKLTPVDCSDSLRRPTLETELAIAHAALIAGYEKEIYDFPEHACICCERLHQRKSVSVVSLSDDFKSQIWCDLKAHVLKFPPVVSGHVLYMCHYCKTRVRSGDMPARCVLNGLQTVPIPPELAKLDLLSRQLIQRAKCYQTIVRLGTYTGKVPTYNSLQACKGTMFFLPLPLSKTLETLNKVDQHSSVLPDPELYIIVNGRPTKSKVVWRTMVNVSQIKTAIKALRSCNWLHKNVNESCIDESTKHIIEVSNNATTEMLKKVTPDEVDAFQAYTIRNLDNKLSMGSDIQQYRLMSVTEDPINSKQQHLDVMCFPVLFPTGKFGEFHPRKECISPSEYVKSRLLNKDPRFCKDAQYVFYLLWQKEM